MAKTAGIAQGHHAALIPDRPTPGALQHFPDAGPEMLQEIRAGCVDLAGKRP